VGHLACRLSGPDADVRWPGDNGVRCCNLGLESLLQCIEIAKLLQGKPGLLDLRRRLQSVSYIHRMKSGSLPPGKQMLMLPILPVCLRPQSTPSSRN
jgi:hypothetical protein